MSELKNVTGEFGASLVRNASKIKEDRGLAIYKSAERVYRRKVEDLQASIDDLQTARTALIDLSPTDINSLVLATDFNSDDFYAKDMKLTMDIREKRVQLEEAEKRYNALFGPKKTAPAVSAE